MVGVELEGRLRGAGVCGVVESGPKLGRQEGVMVTVDEVGWTWFVRGPTPLGRP